MNRVVVDNTIVTVLGRKGFGKTTLVKDMLVEYPRVYVFDYIGEYPGEVVEGIAPCAQAVMDSRDADRFVYSFRIDEETDEGVDGNLAVLELVYEAHEPGGRGCLVVVEEVSSLCSPFQLPRALKKCIRYGRHRRIDQFYVARRPSEVHRDITAMSDIIVTFRHREPRDLEYLEARMGARARGARNLPRFRVLVSGPRSKAPAAILAREVRPMIPNRLGFERKKLLQPAEDMA